MLFALQFQSEYLLSLQSTEMPSRAPTPAAPTGNGTHSTTTLPYLFNRLLLFIHIVTVVIRVPLWFIVLANSRKLSRMHGLQTIIIAILSKYAPISFDLSYITRVRQLYHETKTFLNRNYFFPYQRLP